MQTAQPASRFVSAMRDRLAAALRAAARYYPAVFVAVLLAALWLPFLRFDFGHASLADFEKKYWGHEEITGAFARFRYHVLRDRLFNLMITGSDGWLIYTGELSLDDYQNTTPFSDDDLMEIQSRLDALDARLSAQGIRFLLVIPPNKNTIYADRVPREIPILGAQSRLDQLMAYQRDHGRVQILDLRPALREARQEQEVYYATDTHWNPRGAFVGYQNIMRRLAVDFPRLQPLSADDFAYTPDADGQGDLSILSQARVPDQIFSLEPRFPVQYTQRGMTGPEGVQYLYSSHSDQTLPRLVMYRDSFSAWLVPYLSHHFSRAVYVWTANVDETFIAAEQPDVVILEVTERYIHTLLNLPSP